MSFALFGEGSKDTVALCAIGEQGLATMCSMTDGSLQVFLVADFEDPDVVPVDTELISAFPPTSIAIIEPRVRW